jgi:FtsZ-binding cell division protein ZapB
VREVVPELVSEWADQGADDYLAVDYSRLGALTIEAIKEQQRTIEQQQREIELLKAGEAENKAMREEIKSLQETLRRLAAS